MAAATTAGAAGGEGRTGARAVDQDRKEDTIDATREHPSQVRRVWGASGSSLSCTASASLPGDLGLLRMRFATLGGRLGLIPAQPPFSRSALHQRLLSRTPGFRPSVNSKPAASSTCRRLSTVRLRTLSPRSNRTMVSGDTFAAAANFLTLKPISRSCHPALYREHFLTTSPRCVVGQRGATTRRLPPRQERQRQSDRGSTNPTYRLALALTNALKGT